jgi:hypothetical protein
MEVEEELYAGAEEMAQQGPDLAREAGFEAEPLVVADALSVPDTLVRVAGECDAPAVVVAPAGAAASASCRSGAPRGASSSARRGRSSSSASSPRRTKPAARAHANL